MEVSRLPSTDYLFSQDWVRMQTGARNSPQISHVGSRDTSS